MNTPHHLSPEDMERVRLAAQMSQQGRRKGSGGCFGCLRTIVGGAVVLALGAVFVIGLDSLYAPWAWGWAGRSTLTGEWVGTFRLPQGQRGAAYLNLSHDLNKDFQGSRMGRNLPDLAGTARDCFRANAAQTYALSGGASTGGDDIGLGFSAQKPTVPSYAPQDLKGSWNGTDLTLAGTFVIILDTKGSTEIKSEPNQTQPTTIVFHKATPADFEKACQTLGQ